MAHEQRFKKWCEDSSGVFEKTDFGEKGALLNCSKSSNGIQHQVTMDIDTGSNEINIAAGSDRVERFPNQRMILSREDISRTFFNDVSRLTTSEKGEVPFLEVEAKDAKGSVSFQGDPSALIVNTGEEKFTKG